MATSRGRLQPKLITPEQRSGEKKLDLLRRLLAVLPWNASHDNLGDIFATPT